jgi:hypothetical protein
MDENRIAKPAPDANPDVPDTKPTNNKQDIPPAENPQPTKRFTFIFDFDIYHANNAVEFKQVEVQANDEEEGIFLAAREIEKLRTEENPITYRYRGSFKKIRNVAAE